MRRAAVLLVSLLAACGQADPAAVERSDAEPAPAVRPPHVPAATASHSAGAQVGTLEGEWRVAGIDGGDLNEGYGLALSANVEEMWWNPRCAGMIRKYRIQGFGFSTRPATQSGRAIPVIDNEVPPPPPVVCAIGLPPRLPEVMTALRAATRIERTRSNGVLLSGGGHSLLLFSQ